MTDPENVLLSDVAATLTRTVGDLARWIAPSLDAITTRHWPVETTEEVFEQASRLIVEEFIADEYHIWEDTVNIEAIRRQAREALAQFVVLNARILRAGNIVRLQDAESKAAEPQGAMV